MLSVNNELSAPMLILTLCLAIHISNSIVLVFGRDIMNYASRDLIEQFLLSFSISESLMLVIRPCIPLR
jgi:hypothetical protein